MFGSSVLRNVVLRKSTFFQCFLFPIPGNGLGRNLLQSAAQNAYNCAVDMNEKLVCWNEGRRSAGLPEIQHRIGIHFGPCVVGNIGGEQRVEFAIIGDAVNVASRICDACKQFDTNFLISSTLAERVQTDTRLEIVKDFEVRGRSEKLDLMKVY